MRLGRRHSEAMSVPLSDQDVQLLVRVIHRARCQAQDSNRPDEARVILRLAHSLADELVARDAKFDRGEFIAATTTTVSFEKSPARTGN